MYPESRPSVPEGQPDLVATIKNEIKASGPIPFVRFMELALYEPCHGYYMRAGSAEERIGWNGDYYTSSDLHPIFARAVAHQAKQIDELLGHPDPFTLVEMGPGRGLFARHFLEASTELSGSFADRLRYVLVERSPALRNTQQATLASSLRPSSRISWINYLSEFETSSLVGAFFSNELVDAFPVHRITIHKGQLKELYVDLRDGQFCESIGEPSTPDLARYLERQDIELSEGYTTEFNLHAQTWMKEVARVMGQGLAITVDYGHTAHDLYGPERRRGTLLCYYHHTVSQDPYVRVGLQDMTAHVDFSSLARIGEEAGLHVTGFTNYMSFLTSLGMEEALAQYPPDSKEYQSVIQLLRPDGMGRTFKILIQHKGLDSPELSGLRFRPFFVSMLTATGAENR